MHADWRQVLPARQRGACLVYQSMFFTAGAVFIIGAFALLDGYGGWRMLLLIGRSCHARRSHRPGCSCRAAVHRAGRGARVPAGEPALRARTGTHAAGQGHSPHRSNPTQSAQLCLQRIAACNGCACVADDVHLVAESERGRARLTELFAPALRRITVSLSALYLVMAMLYYELSILTGPATVAPPSLTRSAVTLVQEQGDAGASPCQMTQRQYGDIALSNAAEFAGYFMSALDRPAPPVTLAQLPRCLTASAVGGPSRSCLACAV